MREEKKKMKRKIILKSKQKPYHIIHANILKKKHIQIELKMKRKKNKKILRNENKKT